MPLSAGTRFGPYLITAQIGQGGMGEVYRATDTRLDRQVAIKVLPEGFTQDAERLERFKREAQLLAQLHHPNISSIFGLEDAEGVRGLVMELVDGPTLAERLEAGPLSLDECLSIARQVAEALEEAHEKGIVHRDLKPQNIKASPGGKVKVLDFGLAKALEPPGGTNATTSQLSQSPTLIHSATRMGVILGTAAYMAPEQAVGGAVDRRADIWSFGVVLYEMLTGRRLFHGETVSHVLAAVLKDTPDFAALPAATPARVVDLLRRCLRRKPRERLQSIGDARVILEEVLADPNRDEPAAVGVAGVSAATTRGTRLAWLVAGLGLTAALVFAALWLEGGRGEGPQRIIHAQLAPPEGMAFGDTFALSPDGRHIVFEAYDQKTRVRALWVRSMDRGEASRLGPTDGGELPFWSPDGAHVGFFAEGKLKRVDLQSGSAQVICDAPTPRGGAWGPDGRIVFTDSFRTGLSIVPAAGGEARTLTTLDASRGEKSHRFPVFLPGGGTILFLAQTAEAGAHKDDSAIEALELSSGKRTRLVAANSSPLYSAEGHILFWRDGALMAVSFDAKGLRIDGDPVPIASPVAFNQNEQALATISGEGTLVYREGNRGTLSSVIWLDRKGLGGGVIRDHELLDYMALSNDGTRLAFSVNSAGQGATDLWIQDLARGVAGRFSFEEGGEDHPVWSRDDRFLYYSNDHRNDGTIFRRSADGTGSIEEIGSNEQGMWPLAVSADDRWLVVESVGAESSFDIFRFDMATRKTTPLVTTPFHDDDAALSRDDSLLAYASEQSGRWEVYVQAVGGGHGKWQISSEGGRHPHWSADGREVFFLARPDRIMSVLVEPGDVPHFSAPRELFRQPIEEFGVTPDGQRFVGLRPSAGNESNPMTLISNWTRLIQK